MKPTTPWLAAMCLACPLSFTTHAVEPVLDGHAYVLNGDINIDLDDEIISFDGNLLNCLQDDGTDPVETLGWTLFSNEQSFGVSSLIYNTESERIYLTSETSNLICDNAVYVDTLYESGFEIPE